MLRGSSALLRRSVKHYEPLVAAIVSVGPLIWEVDANRYDSGAIEETMRVAHQLRAALPDPSSDILITKIMLGVFGCVPAFDSYFKRGSGVRSLGPRALQRVGDYYEANSELVERYRIRTIDFETGAPTARRYTCAKVIDMIFFIEGAGRGV